MIIGVSLLMACTGRHEQVVMLDRIDSLMNDHPDSALTMLDSLRPEKANWSKSLRMRFDLHVLLGTLALEVELNVVESIADLLEEQPLSFQIS